MPAPIGFKHFFAPAIQCRGIRIRGIGIKELMQPARVERPQGSGDYFILLLHDPASIGFEPEWDRISLAGTMMIWPPGAAQFYGSTRTFNHSWIHCDGPALAKMVRLSKLPILQPFFTSDATSFVQTLIDVHTELVSYSVPDSIVICNLLENCFRKIGRSLGNTAVTTRIPENLLQVRRWIGTAPPERVTLPQLARIAGMSIPHFCARFKETFGVPPIECLIQHRLQHAAYLLTNQNLNITQIAQRVGYDDLFHFSKAFKKQFGASPREIRKNQQA